MDTKTLLAGLIGFFLGGLLVSTVATVSNTTQHQAEAPMSAKHTTAVMNQNTTARFARSFVQDTPIRAKTPATTPAIMSANE